MTAEWIRKTDQQSVRMESFPPDKVDPGPEYKKFYLKIEAVSIHDAGWYTCQANSSFGSDKDSIFLHVISKWCGHSILTISLYLVITSGHR